MKTKTILRFAVTIVILGLIFLGVWLIWFKPTNELEVFNTLTNLQKADNKSKGYGAYLYAMSGVDEDNKAVGLTNWKHKKSEDSDSETINRYCEGLNFSTITSEGINSNEDYIVYYRFFMLGEDLGTNEDYHNADPYYLQGVTNSVGLQKMYDNIDKAFDYYYAYVQLAQKVDNKDVKEINNLAKALNNSYTNFASTKSDMDSLLDKLSSKSDEYNSNTIMTEVKNLFKTLHSDYFNIVKNYNNLTMTVRDFVIKYAFDNDFAYNKETVYYDILLNSVKEFTSKSINLFVKEGNKEFVANNDDKITDYVDYSLDVARVISSFNKEEKPGVVIDYPDVVTDYIELKDNYSSTINGQNSIFALSHVNKVKFANGDAEIRSKFNSESIKYINNILSKCFGLTIANETEGV